MSDWKKAVAQVAANVEEHFDNLKFQLRKKLGISPVQALPYLGYGTPSKILLRGRALEDYGVSEAADNDTIWKNMLNMYQRFHTKEIPHARVRARLGKAEIETTADEEGFFDIRLETQESLSQIWNSVELELIDYPDQPGAKATGQVIVPPADTRFGIISDLDDTVIQTDVLHLLKVARNTFLRNAHTRLPFAGVAEFYTALQKGPLGTGYNPIFYVSNSPWNLYDLLIDFFGVRQIPLGAFFLTDLGLTSDHLIRVDPFEHKLEMINEVFSTYPKLPFLLIGDSGEKDPEIYVKALRLHPGRIPAIYIRDVTEKIRDNEIQRLIAEARDLGSEMVLVPDTVGAAVHAAEHGYIDPAALPNIRQERTQDKTEPEPLERIIDKLP